MKLSGKWKSEFVIRTQPFNECLCTMEAVAIALGQLENKPTLIDVSSNPNSPTRFLLMVEELGGVYTPPSRTFLVSDYVL